MKEREILYDAMDKISYAEILIRVAIEAIKHGDINLSIKLLSTAENCLNGSFRDFLNLYLAKEKGK